MIFSSFGISKRKRNHIKESQRRKRQQAFRRASRRSELETLEERMVLTSYLFIDYGDNFPGGTLTTTQGDFQDVADSAVPDEKILGTPLPDASGFNAGTQLDIIAQTFSADDRAKMLDVVQRGFEAVDVTVVELTSASQTLADGRTVSAASSMADVIANLQGGDAAAKDAYVFVATFVADPGGANELTYTGGGGLSPSDTLGVMSDLNSASNTHDDVAVVYSAGGFSFNTMNNISHEAGHLLGLRHGITTALTSPPVANADSINLLHQAEIMSYRNTNNTSSSTFMRYPSIRGDNNTEAGDLTDYDDIAPRNGEVTNYDQLANDAGVGANPNHHFVSGTGLHDVITLTANGGNVDVTIQAFTDNTYTTALTVPSEADSIFSYSIPANNTILIHAGDSDDRIVINGDLGVDVDIDGMRGTDSLVINGLGAAMATYTPDATTTTGVDLTGGGTRIASFGGSVMVGAGTIFYDNFDAASNVSIEDFGTVEFVAPGTGSDVLTASVIAGVPTLTGTVDGGNPIIPVGIQQTGGEFVVTTGAGDDQLTVDFGAGNPLPPGDLTFNAGGNAGDDMVLNNGAFDTVRHFLDNSTDGRVEFDDDNSDNSGAVETRVHYFGLAPIADNLNVVNREFDFGAGDDQDVVVRDNGLAADGLNVIEAPSNAETVTFTNPTGSMTVNLGDGADIMELLLLDTGFAADINLLGGEDSDEIRIAATPAGTTTSVDLGLGVPDDRLVVGAATGSGGTIAINFAQFNTGASTLDFILGDVDAEDSGGVGEIYVDDSGDGDADNVTFTATSIAGASPGTIFYNPGDPGNDFTFVHLALGTGSDVVDVQSTGSNGFSGNTTIWGNDGDDTFVITGDGLSDENIFLGNDGIDRFVVNVATELGAGSVTALQSLLLDGGNPNLDTNQRDSLEIIDASGAARTFTYDYLDTPGQLGLENGFAIDVDVSNIESMIFDDNGDNNDVVTIEGTSGIDQLTVAPFTASSALVFLGGNPWDGPNDAEAFVDAHPGVAGGGAGPDLQIHGIDPGSTLSVDDGDASTAADDDQLFVYGATVAGLNDPATTVDPWDPTGVGNGFSQGGVGQLMPMFGNAFDQVLVSDAAVAITNAGVGPLVTVGPVDPTEDFVKINDSASLRGLVVNTGDETLAGPIADDISALLSFNFGIQINGGDPDPSNAPSGDRLNVITPGEINVFSDKDTPPEVSITSSDPLTGTPTHPLTFSSIENTLLTPGLTSQTVNLFGDDNTAVGQNDNFVVVGQDVDSLAPSLAGFAANPLFNPTGAAVNPQFDVDPDGDNEFLLMINGSAPIGFRNVTDLNVFGDDDSALTPSTDFVDTLEITPYADDTPQGWGIDVSFDEGLPAGADGDQVDLLIYHTSAFGGEVSENISVRPSGPDNGELIVTYASFGTPIVDIDYVANTDIIINDDDGFLNDTDTLTLFGTDGTTPQTSGNETFVANFTLAGTAGNNIVNVSDSDSGMLLYGIRDINNIDVVNFELLDGNDEITILGQSGGGVGGDIDIDTVNVMGGAGDDTLILDNSDGLSSMGGGITYHGGTGSDQLMLVGSTTVDASVYTVGPTADSGSVVHTLGGDVQAVHFTGLEPVIDLVPAATLTINATNAANAISYSQSELNPAWGKVSVDGFEPIHFANKTQLIINSAGGSDEISLANATTPTGLTGIVVNGGDPTGGSDVAILGGTAGADAVNFAVSSADDAVVTGAGPVPITLATVESAIFDGNGGGDSVTYTTPVGLDLVTLNRGADLTSASITGVSGFNSILMPFAYTDIAPLPVTLTFADQGGGRSDVLEINGTDSGDVFNVDNAGGITVNDASTFIRVYGPAIATPGVGQVVLLGLDGDDTFNVVGNHPFTGGVGGAGLEIEGGNPDSGSDVLNFTGAGGLVTLDLQTSTLVEGGAVTAFAGIETLGIDANASLTVNTTNGDDVTTVSPTGPASGVLQNNDDAPVVNFNDVGVLLIDQLAGSDVLQVNYDSADNSVTVNVPTSTISDIANEPVTFANTESIRVSTGAGDDSITATPGVIPVFIDGGDPVGVLPGDILTVLATPGVMFTPGPESDEGGFSFDAAEPISFDHIESVNVDLANAGGVAVVMGTGADDDITATGIAPGIVDVQVNDGPVVRYTNATNLSLLGKNGDDDITVDINAANDVTFVVDGGLPTAGSDDLRVTGVDGVDDAPVWTPNAADGGVLTFAGLMPVIVTTIENLYYDGESDDETLAIAGSGAFVHTPGSAIDAGRMDLTSGGATYLGINYENLGGAGTVAANGTGVADVLTVMGTSSDDIASLGFTGANAALFGLQDQFGDHVDVLSQDVENYAVQLLAGEDLLTVNSTVQASGNVTLSAGGAGDVIRILGNDAAVEDVRIAPEPQVPTDQLISGVSTGASLLTVGFESIIFEGGNAADSLTVELGLGDNTARVDRGLGFDRVTSDALPEILFADFDSFVVDAAGIGDGSDVVTFKTWFLAGAAAANYSLEANVTDTLIVEGSDGAIGDRFTATNPAGNVVVQDGFGANVTLTATGLGRLAFNTLGGDDQVIVDVGSTDLISAPIAYDGGDGSDLLTVIGDPATTVDEVIYTPGQAVTDGRLLYEDAADTALMTIDFTGLEPVNEFVVAANLTVNGTNEENDITYTEGPVATVGRVTVDGFELVDFANKVNLNLYGNNGADTIVVNNASLPLGLETVTVNGGEGDDQVDVLALPDASATSFVSATLLGEAGDDHLDGSNLLVDTPLTIDGGQGVDILIGGRGDDSLIGGLGDDLMIGGDSAITPDIGDNDYDGGAGFDTIGILGTSAPDTIDVNQLTAASLTAIINGDTANETFANTEAARIDGELGSDTVRLTIDDTLFANAATPATTVLAYTVVGDANGASDRLHVVDDGLGDTIIHRLSRVDDYGTIEFAPAHPNGPAAPIVYEGVERIDITPIDNITGETGADGNGQLFVFKADPFEANDQLFNATFLGSGANINVDPTIDPGPGQLGTPADQDWYRFVADRTGTLDVQVYFSSQGPLANGRTGLPGNGNLDLFAFDEEGNLIAGNGNFGNAENAADDIDERIRIPVVAGQTYYVQVAAAAADPTAVNIYNLTAINDAPPVPYDLELNDIVQVGTITVNAANTTTFTATIAPTNPALDPPTNANDYIGKTVEFTSGDNVGRRAIIANFAAGTFTLNAIGNLLTAAPEIGDTFIIESTDTGRSQLDDVTRDNTPIITLRLDDDIFFNDVPGDVVVGNPPDEQIQIPFNTSQAADIAAPGAIANAGFRVALFVEGSPQQAGTGPQEILGYARRLPGVAGVYIFDFGVDAEPGAAAFLLNDGSHFISARVEMIDPSLETNAFNDTAFGDRSESLEIVVDTVAPPAYFGEPDVDGDGLHPNSDSGVISVPATLVDHATNDTTPTFFGRAEADSIVRAYIDVNGDNILDNEDILIGQTVATPYDGTNQHPFGEWELTSTVNLNAPHVLAAMGGIPIDGLRNILITAEDVAGNETPADEAISLEIFVDTQGPRVYDPAGDEGAIYFPVQPAYDVLDPKPSEDGPTPVVDEIRVNIEDLPARAAGFLYAAIQAGPDAPVPAIPGAPNALLLPPSSVDLIGDYNGNIPIQDVSFVSDDPILAGNVATGEIVIRFAQPIPDDRFTLTIHDILTDPVGNALDGEFNTDEPPTGDPSLDPPNTDFAFPSGDLTPGGDFVARFTVDTRPEIGVWAAGNIWVDTNGNTSWDPDNPDFVHRDIAYAMGFTTDDIFAGNFSNTPASVADGFDKLGAYGSVNGQFRWLIDTDNDGTVDLDISEPSNVNGLPIAGDFDGNAVNGDEVGVFDGTTWWFDTNHDYILDTQLATTMKGYPLIGDFDGDGAYDLGTWADDTFMLDVSSEGGITGNPDYTFRFGFVGSRERPVAHDFNMDGYDDLGLWAPDRTGTTPGEGSEWYILVSGDVQGLDPALDSDGDGVLNGVDPDADNDGITDATLMERIRTDVRLGVNVIDYKPTPFGYDLYYQFGDSFAYPIVGNFDPPVSPSDVENPYAGGNMHFNPDNQFDVNADGVVNVADLRIVLNDQMTNGPRQLLGAALDKPYLDVNQDGYSSVTDLRFELSYLLGGGGDAAEAEAEGEAGSSYGISTEIVTMLEAPEEQAAPQVELESSNAPVDWALLADAVFSDRDEEESTPGDLRDSINEFLDDLFDL